MTGLARAAQVLAVVWAGLAFVGGVFGDVNPDARAFVLGATAVAVVAGIATVVLVARGRTRPGGIALVVAGLCAPTFGLAALNLIPIAVGGLLATRAERSPAA